MAEVKEYNNFSAKLKKHLPVLKPGDKLRFQLNGIHYSTTTKKLVCPKSFSLAKIDRIWDPWAKLLPLTPGKQKGTNVYEGAYVDIGFIVRETPGGAQSNRDTNIEFGRIEFTSTLAGVIEIAGGNRAHEKMLPYLFFGNRNASNEGEEWYIKPAGPHVYHQIKTAEKAKVELSKELKIDQAKAMITSWSDEEVHESAAGLFPHRHNSMSKDEKILQLRVIAVNTPEKIIDISKDVQVKTTALVEEFLKAHLIIVDTAKGQWQWAEDKVKICTIYPGKTPHSSIKSYFMTEDGIEVLISLEKLLATTKASIKEKTVKAEV